jgi:hypothetical protein
VHGRTTPATPDDVPIPDAAGMDADWLNFLMTASQIVPWGARLVPVQPVGLRQDARSTCSAGTAAAWPRPSASTRPQAVTLGKPVRQHIITVFHRPPPPPAPRPDLPLPAATSTRTIDITIYGWSTRLLSLRDPAVQLSNLLSRTSWHATRRLGPILYREPSISEQYGIKSR